MASRILFEILLSLGIVMFLVGGYYLLILKIFGPVKKKRKNLPTNLDNSFKKAELTDRSTKESANLIARPIW